METRKVSVERIEKKEKDKKVKSWIKKEINVVEKEKKNARKEVRVKEKEEEEEDEVEEEEEERKNHLDKSTWTQQKRWR